jgi:hypothetical protein
LPMILPPATRRFPPAACANPRHARALSVSSWRSVARDCMRMRASGAARIPHWNIALCGIPEPPLR